MLAFLLKLQRAGRKIRDPTSSIEQTKQFSFPKNNVATFVILNNREDECTAHACGEEFPQLRAGRFTAIRWHQHLDYSIVEGSV